MLRRRQTDLEPGTQVSGRRWSTTKRVVVSLFVAVMAGGFSYVAWDTAMIDGPEPIVGGMAVAAACVIGLTVIVGVLRDAEPGEWLRELGNTEDPPPKPPQYGLPAGPAHKSTVARADRPVHRSRVERPPVPHAPAQPSAVEAHVPGQRASAGRPTAAALALRDLPGVHVAPPVIAAASAAWSPTPQTILPGESADAHRDRARERRRRLLQRQSAAAQHQAASSAVGRGEAKPAAVAAQSPAAAAGRGVAPGSVARSGGRAPVSRPSYDAQRARVNRALGR